MRSDSSEEDDKLDCQKAIKKTIDARKANPVKEEPKKQAVAFQGLAADPEALRAPESTGHKTSFQSGSGSNSTKSPDPRMLKASKKRERTKSDNLFLSPPVLYKPKSHTPNPQRTKNVVNDQKPYVIAVSVSTALKCALGVRRPQFGHVNSGQTHKKPPLFESNHPVRYRAPN